MNAGRLPVSRASRARRAGSIIILASLALVLTRCAVDQATNAGAPALINLALRPVLPPNFSFFAANLTVDQVQLTLIRPPSEVLARVTKAMPADSGSVRFAITATLAAASESLLAVLDYQTAQGVTLFTGQVSVLATTGTPTPTAPSVPLVYSGPGLNIAALTLTPLDDTLQAGDTVVYGITAIDSAQQPVSSFYVSWLVSDPNFTINAVGQLIAPDLSRRFDVIALTPNGTSAQTTLTVLGSKLGVLPDSVEKLPSGQQQFIVQVGTPGPYIWSVNGIDGGNTTFGTIDTAGFYQAPQTVPSPNSFQVCARVAATPTMTGCAKVVITQVPSAGADVIVFNDINMLANFMNLPGNAQLVRNLVNFQSTGSRRNGSVVLFDYSHGSKCGNDTECDFTTTQPMRQVITGQRMTVDTLQNRNGSLGNIPLNVKVIFMWTPLVPYDTTEINTLKLFAAQGGRIVFLGERLPYYGQFGIDSVENRFFREMGAQLVNIGADVALQFPYVVPVPASGRHQIMTGVDSLAFSAASIITPGPNDFALVRDTTATADVLGAVAKIDLTPLPAPPIGPMTARVRSPAERARTTGPVGVSPSSLPKRR